MLQGPSGSTRFQLGWVVSMGPTWVGAGSHGIDLVAVGQRKLPDNPKMASRWLTFANLCQLASCWAQVGSKLLQVWPKLGPSWLALFPSVALGPAQGRMALTWLQGGFVMGHVGSATPWPFGSVIFAGLYRARLSPKTLCLPFFPFWLNPQSLGVKWVVVG